jgi:LacI family transcriptional regulator
MQLAQLVQPKLTIVTQPLTEIGKNAAEILLAKLADSQLEPKVVTLSTEIAHGGSVKTLL